MGIVKKQLLQQARANASGKGVAKSAKGFGKFGGKGKGVSKGSSSKGSSKGKGKSKGFSKDTEKKNGTASGEEGGDESSKKKTDGVSTDKKKKQRPGQEARRQMKEEAAMEALLPEVEDLTNISWYALQEDALKQQKERYDRHQKEEPGKKKHKTFSTLNEKFNALILDSPQNDSSSDSQDYGLSEETCKYVYEEKCSIFERIIAHDEEQMMLTKMAAMGTSSDKIASLSTKIRMMPLFSLPHLRILLMMAQKNNRQESSAALETLKNLCVSDDLLPDRNLRYFEDNVRENVVGIVGNDILTQKKKDGDKETTATTPIFDPKVLRNLRLTIYFEDSLKIIYAGFLQALVAGTQDSVSFHKQKCIEFLGELLQHKSEQEHMILQSLVNKFGDSETKIASLVAKTLSTVIQSQPSFKVVVAKEIERFVRSPNLKLTARGKYCATLFLTELQLDRRFDVSLALQLVNFYSHVLGQIFVLGGHEMDNIHSESKGKGKCGAEKGKGKDGKKGGDKKIQKGKGTSSEKGNGKSSGGVKDEVEEEQNRLVRTVVVGIKRAIPYLSPEVDANVFDSMVDNLFRVCHTISAFATRVSMLGLLFKILKRKDDVNDRFFRTFYDLIKDFELYHTNNRAEFLSLTRDVVLSDDSITRVIAFLRRLCQLSSHIDAVVTASALLLLNSIKCGRASEMKKIFEVIEKEEVEIRGEAKSNEVKRGETNKTEPKAEEATESKEESKTSDDKKDEAKKTVVRGTEYDLVKRDPMFACADKSFFWELHTLTYHSDPTVSTLAKNLITNTPNDLISQSLQVEKLSSNELLELYALENKGTNQHVLPHEEFLRLYFHQDLIKAKRRSRKDIDPENMDDADIEELGKKKQKKDPEAEEWSDDDDEADEEDDEVVDAEDEEIDTFFDSYLEKNMPKNEDPDFKFDFENESGSDGDDISDEEEEGSNEDEVGSDDMSDEETDINSKKSSKTSKADKEKLAAMLKADGQDMDIESEDDGEKEGDDDEEEEDSEKEPVGSGEDSDKISDEEEEEDSDDLHPELKKKMEKAKKLVKKHAHSAFASAEDFEDLLDV